MHAVGCYTVYREIKTSLRRAEHIVHQAEIGLGETPLAVDPDLLERSWRHISFAAFHDTLGGTCLPTAYRQVVDQLGFACSTADEALHIGLRKKAVALPDCKRQRIIAWNASDQPCNGYVEFEPWLQRLGLVEGWRLLDENGVAVPHQRIDSEAPSDGLLRILFPAKLPAGALEAFEIDNRPGQPKATVDSPAVVQGSTLVSGSTRVGADALTFGAISLPKPRLDLIVDETDTWSHNIDRYTDTVAASAMWEAPKVADMGPLMASTIQHGRIGESRLTAEWRVYAGQPYAELRLRVHWLEKFKVLKLVTPWEAGPSRIDGISGGSLVRPNGGKELPLRDWTALDGAAGRLGIVCPDVYALDADQTRVRLTLLRSPLIAWHIPNKGTAPRASVSDQGFHDFRFRFYVGSDVSVETLDDDAIAFQRPPITGDLTKGMPAQL